jgi:predicted AAA+ superfamily ATPase
MRLIRLDPTQLTGPTVVNNPVVGGLLEAFVTSELSKQAAWSQQSYSLYHFRDSDGIEVDIVLEYDNGDVVLIEVKASSTYGSDQTAGILALAKRLGKRFRAGIVLGTSSQGHALGDRITGLPISTLWQPGAS